MDTSVILRISGHKHIKMMKYYTHLDEKFVNKEFDKPVEFTKLAEAEEYRKSIALNKQHMVSEEVI